MFKTLFDDRKVIENKFHKQNEPFDPFRRMDYHGYDYDESTGLDDIEMDARLAEIASQNKHLPMPVQKAILFAFVTDNTRIDINEHDYFIGIYSWNRPISKYIVVPNSNEVRKMFSEEYAIIDELCNAGAVHGWLDFDHTVPDWDSLARLGFSGILQRARDSRERLLQENKLTQKQQDFFEAIEIEYSAILRLIDRLYRYALSKSFEKAPVIAKSLLNLRDGAPKTTLDMLQLIYIYFMLSESIEHYQVRSLGYGLDSTLLPFYLNDIKSGIFSHEQLCEYIGYFLMQWAAIDNYWGQPFYLGGTNPDGTTKVTPLSYAILDVYDKLGLYNPKIQVKIGPSTPKEFVIKILEMVRHGVSSFVFVNEETVTRALMAEFKITYEEALDSVISGCYEYKPKNDGIGISCGYINALKAVSLAIDNGYDTKYGKQLGPKTGACEELATFDDFYNAYITQYTKYVTDFTAAMTKIESRVELINPSIMFSATIPQCVDSLTDAMDNGITNTADYLLSAIGSAVDSLMAVKELVYNKKLVTLSQLKTALDNNWEGFEVLRAKAMKNPCRYGNGNAEADSYAAAIANITLDILKGFKNGHDGKIKLEMHSARAFIDHGQRTKATPDGRKSGDETSKNASPAPGSDRSGITAFIKSAIALYPASFTTGFGLDAMLHPSAVQGEDGLEALYAVLDSYMKMGGGSIQFNIFNPEMLIDAQNNPEKYRNLQVRVCGWNILWNSMARTEQDAYIYRSKNIM